MKRTYQQAMEPWGVELQMNMVQEECGECVAAINRFRRGRIEESSMVEEIVDIYIMAEQMKFYYPVLFNDIYKEKTDRLKQIVEYEMTKRGN